MQILCSELDPSGINQKEFKKLDNDFKEDL